VGLLDWFRALPLRRQLKSRDWSVRLQAVEELGFMGTGASSAVAELVPHLQDEEQVVRRATARALRAIADPRGLIEVGRAALEEGRGPELPTLIDCLRHPNENVRWGAALALGHLGEAAMPAIPVLVERMSDESDDVRRLASEALAGLGRPAEPTLTRLLTHEHDFMRENAREALVQLERH